jgi:glycosyltransferase involved in cell wall biosynthesis
MVFVPEEGTRVWALFALWRKAARAFRENRFDIVTVQDTAYLACLAYLLARKYHMPFEVQVHGFEKLRGMRKIIARFVLRRADRVRVVSERLRKEVVERFGVQKEKIYVLSVYVQVEAGMNYKTSPDTFTFLTVGRLVPVKNIALQIRAFAKVVSKSPHARLVIVGSGYELPRLQLLTTHYSLQTHIHFVGKQEKVSQFYQTADAFILTSDAEGWGVAVVEAAAHALPIIMTDVGCAGEFIKNGENGLVIPVGDEMALVEAMKRLIADEPFRRRLGAVARAAFLALPRAEESIHKQVEEWCFLV